MNKKMIRIVLIVLAIAAVLGAVLFWLSRKPAVSSDYQTKTTIQGELEKKYMADGPYSVSTLEQKVLQNFKKYVLFYPQELESSSRAWPVIVLCNGTGVPISRYPTLARHYASWGFIVIATEEAYAWNGFGAEMSMRHLERLNTEEALDDKGTSNPFRGKIDLDKAGIAGHSQGAVGVMNAITTQSHHDAYKAAVSISPTNETLAHNLEWDYDPTQIQTPILLLSEAGGGDDWVVTGEQLQEIYDQIPADKVMMRRKDTPHGDMLYKPDGYVLAWFMWHLQDDQEAAKAFIGDQAEILSNPDYQDQITDLPGMAS